MEVKIPVETLKELSDRLSMLEQEIKAIKIQIRNLYAEEGKEILVQAVRWLAPLAEVERAGGVVTPLELSWFCRKYGKNPKGAAGYFTGAKPSMKSIGDNKRALTDYGLKRLRQAEAEYGPHWIDKIPLDIVANPEVDGDTVLYI
ncbi:MAG: hypothetical protein H0Z39_07480 [Peptococcaceae bacterium]|nr:hypothetical protein [Peptococcaceae bacterium]